MTQRTDPVFFRALSLPPEKRAKLAHQLLESLEVLSEVEIEELWGEEALRRHEEMRSGKVLGRSAKQVLKKARARLK